MALKDSVNQFSIFTLLRRCGRAKIGAGRRSGSEFIVGVVGIICWPYYATRILDKEVHVIFYRCIENELDDYHALEVEVEKAKGYLQALHKPPLSK